MLGAAAVWVEFDSSFSSFGSVVTLLELLPRIVPTEDEEVSKELERCFKKRNIAMRTDARVQSAILKGKGVEVVVVAGNGGKTETLASDLLLLGVGRRPKSDGLG